MLLNISKFIIIIALLGWTQNLLVGPHYKQYLPSLINFKRLAKWFSRLETANTIAEYFPILL